jgi:hypothetical protein
MPGVSTMEYSDISMQDKRALRDYLMQEFSDKCFFTDLTTDLSIEHFVPRNKDKITFKYDFWEPNLFISSRDYNSWKGNKMDQKRTEQDFLNWLEYISDFDKFFEYELSPSPKIMKDLELPNSLIIMKLVAKNNNHFVTELIEIFGLNKYSPTGKINETLAHRRYWQTNP